MDTKQASNFLLQLQMIRYDKLLTKIQQLYNVPEERMAVLRAKIINANYIQVK